jgi:Ca2+-binding RTX toxin-like protein
MADIRLAGNYIPWTGNLGHLQLVYGPNELEVQAPGLPYPTPFFGRWDVRPETGTTVPEDFSSQNYSEQIITFSQDENGDDVWDTLLQMRDDVAAVSGSLPYDIIFNSNSYINTLLNAVGININEFLPYPQKVNYYPGVGQDAAQYWGVVWSVTGTAGTNVLVGGTGADEFAGGGGIDFLDGGKGDDHLHGDTVTSSNDSSADYLTGGGGRDTFHVGNADMNEGLFIYDPVSGTETFNVGARGTYDLILDYSRFDNIEVTWAGGTNTSFSNFQIEAADYTIDGKDVYYAT